MSELLLPVLLLLLLQLLLLFDTKCISFSASLHTPGEPPSNILSCLLRACSSSVLHIVSSIIALTMSLFWLFRALAAFARLTLAWLITSSMSFGSNPMAVPSL